MERKKYALGLLGLRGLAAAMVVTFHFAQQDDQFAHISDASLWGASLRQLISHGYLWVDLFFVISGYVLFQKYGAIRLNNFDTSRYSDFLLKRFARTYPLYIATTIFVLMIWFLEPVHNIDHWPSEMFNRPVTTILPNLLLVQAWGLAPSLNSPAWSLSVEWLMYFLFPLISELAHVRRPIIMISATFVIACSLGLLVHSTGKNDHPLDYHDYFEPQAIARGAIGFMLGALIRGAEVHSRFKWFVSRIWTLPASTAVVAVLLSTPGTDYISVLSFPLLVSAIANVNLEYCGNVPSRMLAAAGGLSYSVYLIHDQLHTTRTFINEVLTSTPTTSSYMMYLLFSFVVLYAIAGIIYVLVEQPARTLIVRLASSHKTSHKGSPTAMFPQMSNIVSSYQRIRIGGGATRRLHLTLWRGAVVWIRSDY